MPDTALIRRARRDLFWLVLVFVALLIFSSSVDAYEGLYEFSREHEAWQLDEVIMAVFLATGAIAVFAFRRWHEARLLLREVAVLEGLLPLCSWCRKVRDEQGYWQSVEGYISDRSELSFSHGMCEECRARLEDGRAV